MCINFLCKFLIFINCIVIIFSLCTHFTNTLKKIDKKCDYFFYNFILFDGSIRCKTNIMLMTYFLIAQAQLDIYL